MMKRRKARELSLAFLYQMDIRGELEQFSEDALNSFLKDHIIEDTEIIEFTQVLIKGTIQNLPSIDKKIAYSSINWVLQRMPYIDRNILRIAVYELLFLNEVPERVSINEAIELAKKYSAKESPNFINGVLHKIKEECITKTEITKEDEQK